MKAKDLIGNSAKATQIGKDLAKSLRARGGGVIPGFMSFVSRGPILELKSPAELNILQNALQDVFKDLGLNVAFTHHFVERLFGREQKVGVREIVSAFQKLKAKYRAKLEQAKESGEFEGIIKDFHKDLNIVFAIDDPNLEAITVMRKDPSQFHVNSAGGVEFRV